MAEGSVIDLRAAANKKIFLSEPHMSGLEMNYINEAFRTNWIAPMGPNIEAFEREITASIGAGEAVALNSGTAAIHLALILLGVKKNDTVFCSSFTFVASANPILYEGAVPVFIDSEPDTWNMSPSALDRALREANKMNKLPKAVIVVHLYGQPAKMNELIKICNQYEVPIVEDAAEALGSLYDGKAAGTLGEFGIFSFNGNKIITTSGGGVIVSSDRKALEKARFLAAQAKDYAPYYQHTQLGYNYRMSNISAGIGRGQLQVLQDRIQRKREVFEFYKAMLSGTDFISFLPELPGTFSNRWLTAVTFERNCFTRPTGEIIELLALEGIEARRLWKPLHLQPLFSSCAFYNDDRYSDKAVADQLFRTGICLPSGTSLTDEDLNYVIQSLLRILN